MARIQEQVSIHEEIEMSDVDNRRTITNEEHNTALLDSQKQSRRFNSYATNKTIGQGFLDVALMATNVSQMKFILQVGERHPHYILLLVAISASLFLQTIVGLLLILLVNRSSYKPGTNRINQLNSMLIFIITTLNILISGFQMEATTLTRPSIESCRKFYHEVLNNTNSYP